MVSGYKWIVWFYDSVGAYCHTPEYKEFDCLNSPIFFYGGVGVWAVFNKEY